MNDAARPRDIVRRAMRLPLSHRFRLAGRLPRDRRVPLRARLPLLLLLLYLAMPLDIVPDFIPVLGQLDDLLVAGIAVWWFLRVCPPAPILEAISLLERTPVRRRDQALVWVALCLSALSGAWLVGRWIGG